MIKRFTFKNYPMYTVFLYADKDYKLYIYVVLDKYNEEVISIKPIDTELSENGVHKLILIPAVKLRGETKNEL